MATPKPGQPVRGSDSGRPIMALLDLLGRRWVMRVIWELRGAPLTFRELQERCGGMSPTVLNLRLRELRETGIVCVAEAGGYTLSAAGAALLVSMGPLLDWAAQWKASAAD